MFQRFLLQFDGPFNRVREGASGQRAVVCLLRALQRSERFGVDTWTVFGDMPALGQQLDTMAPVLELLKG